MKNVELVLTNSAALVSPIFHVPKDFLSCLVPNPQEDDAKFREFSKRAEDGPCRAGRLSKTFPEVPTVFRVSSCPLGLGIFKGWLGKWDAPELLAVSGS